MFNMKRNPVRKEQVTAVLAVALFYGALQLAGITCPIKYITGISCPGCGMTRAWLSLLLRGDLKAAFHYHPLFWILVPAVPLFLCRHRSGKAEQCAVSLQEANACAV